MEQKQDALYPIIIGLNFASIGALVIGFYFNGYFSGSIAELQAGTNWLLLAIWLMLLSGFMSIDRRFMSIKRIRSK